MSSGAASSLGSRWMLVASSSARAGQPSGKQTETCARPPVAAMLASTASARAAHEMWRLCSVSVACTTSCTADDSCVEGSRFGCWSVITRRPSAEPRLDSPPILSRPSSALSTDACKPATASTSSRFAYSARHCTSPPAITLTSSPMILPRETEPVLPACTSRLPSTWPTRTLPRPVATRVRSPRTVSIATSPSPITTSTVPSSQPCTSTDAAASNSTFTLYDAGTLTVVTPSCLEL
mmetsp:Transcript_30410/g.78865  ORF Transcript_30410/g.78865 Transcript_30410/m.78865 type:complete len:237 (+) Transcript_30410:361-1071(+)